MMRRRKIRKMFPTLLVSRFEKYLLNNHFQSLFVRCFPFLLVIPQKPVFTNPILFFPIAIRFAKNFSELKESLDPFWIRTTFYFHGGFECKHRPFIQYQFIRIRPYPLVHRDGFPRARVAGIISLVITIISTFSSGMAG